MPLPDNFSPWSHLFEQLIASHNPIVERSFPGLEFGDLSTSLGGMYTACVIQTDDTAEMVAIRLFLYYFVYKGNLPTPVYSYPIPDYQADFTYRPQVILLFEEDNSLQLMEAGLRRATARIGFRLMHQTTQSLTTGYLTTLANEVKVQFGEGRGYTFTKGLLKYSYYDPANGFSLILTVETESVGNTLAEKVLSLTSASFDESKVSISNSRASFPPNPGTQVILGKNYRKPRRRPMTSVRFYRAEVHIHGAPRPTVLIDKRDLTRGLVTAY